MRERRVRSTPPLERADREDAFSGLTQHGLDDAMRGLAESALTLAALGPPIRSTVRRSKRRYGIWLPTRRPAS
jgi:hypothetical protein